MTERRIVGSTAGVSIEPPRGAVDGREMATHERGVAALRDAVATSCIAEVVRIEALEPPLEPLGVLFVGREVSGLGLVDDPVLDEDRRLGAERQRDRVARPRVDRDRLAVDRQVDQRVEGVVLQIGDDDLVDRRPAGRGSRSGAGRASSAAGVVTFSIWRAMALASSDPTQIGSTRGPVLVAENDDGHVGRRIDHQALDRSSRSAWRPCSATASATSRRASDPRRDRRGGCSGSRR